MDYDKIINTLHDRIDILSESKMMHNRFYVSKANRLIRKILKHDNSKTINRKY